MQRALVIVGLCVAALVAWRSCDRSDRAAPRVRAGVTVAKRVDPRSLPHGSISGTVRDDAGPIAGARVCVSELPCETTDARGGYRIAVLRTHHVVHVSALRHRPDVRSVDVTGDMTVDVELARGGVELTGVISDLSGGPIARARVLADEAVTETGDDGTFSVWVAAGGVGIVVSAEGYAPLVEETTAPRHVLLALVPEGIISGSVIDATTKAPVEGVRVEADRAVTITDARGAFRLPRLPAGAIQLTATSPTGYGRSVGSVAVGVGATTTGVVIELHPAVTVTGRVMLENTPCQDASVELKDVAKVREATLEARGDTVVAEGVLPGTYAVDVRCHGAVPREEYPPLVVGREPVEATWEVHRGGRIEGRVTTRAGVPIGETGVFVRAVVRAPKFSWFGATTNAQGRYVIEGVPPGTTSLRTGREHGPDVTKEVEVTRGGVVQHDFVLDDVGTIEGSVRDAAGRPVDGCFVVAKRAGADDERALDATSDARGAFAIRDAPPGTYVIEARQGTCGEGARTTVTARANEVSRATFTVKRTAGTISGTVVDSANRPVADAFIHVAQDNEYAWILWDARRGAAGARAMTGVDGTFRLLDVPDGKYQVRAVHPAVAEATAERVSPGANLTLKFRPTGSISGTVRSWSSTLDDLRINIADRATGYARDEHFFRTGGAFLLENLPAGRYTIAAGAEGQETQIVVDLAEGERKRTVDIALVPLVTITGRVVDHLTKQPVAGVHVGAHAGASTQFSGGPGAPTDASGRFTRTRVPVGDILLLCSGRRMHQTHVMRTVRGAGTVDLGDVPVMQERTNGQGSGESGLELAEFELSASARVVVESVAPTSSAATAGIVAGDVITSIDGLDTRGYAANNAWNALVAPAGTTLAITLARGVTVDVLLR